MPVTKVYMRSHAISYLNTLLILKRDTTEIISLLLLSEKWIRVYISCVRIFSSRYYTNDFDRMHTCHLPFWSVANIGMITRIELHLRQNLKIVSKWSANLYSRIQMHCGCIYSVYWSLFDLVTTPSRMLSIWSAILPEITSIDDEISSMLSWGVKLFPRDTIFRCKIWPNKISNLGMVESRTRKWGPSNQYIAQWRI